MKLVVGLAALIVIAFAASLLAGRVWLPPSSFLSGPDSLAWLIIHDVRLPRTVLALITGAVLALSGAVLQGFTRNPLAEPALLGVSSGAALGAVIAIYFGLAALSPVVSAKPSRCIVRLSSAFIQVATPSSAPRAFKSSSAEPVLNATVTPASRHSFPPADGLDVVTLVVSVVVSVVVSSAHAVPAPTSRPSDPTIHPIFLTCMVFSLPTKPIWVRSRATRIECEETPHCKAPDLIHGGAHKSSICGRFAR